MAGKGGRSKYSGIIYVIVSILVILIILFILYHLYYYLRQEPVQNKTVEETETLNEADVLQQLEELRKRTDFAWPENQGSHELETVQHTALSLGYSEEHKQAAWVAYLLSQKHARNVHKRRNHFREDPAVSTSSASPSDYSNSGYDRGHLAPAADFDYNRKILSETFYMSNISPQKPELNRGNWNELEGLVRDWATEYDSLFIVTGPVLEKGLKKIGASKVSVPKYFYKIIFDPKQPEIKMIGFLMPNTKSNKDISDYAVPVDSIEQLSRLDFFTQLPDQMEDSLEKSVRYQGWFKKE